MIMRISNALYRLLALLLAVCCLAVPVSGEDAVDFSQLETIEAPTTRELAFGSVCILNGCRTAAVFSRSCPCGHGYPGLAADSERLQL